MRPLLELVSARLPFEPGMLVVARRRITEDDADPDPNAEPLEPGWVHCEPGDVGVVEAVHDFQHGHPDVLFFRAGTLTLCFQYEVVPVVFEA